MMPCEKAVLLSVKDGFKNGTEVSFFKKLLFFHFLLWSLGLWVSVITNTQQWENGLSFQREFCGGWYRFLEDFFPHCCSFSVFSPFKNKLLKNKGDYYISVWLDLRQKSFSDPWILFACKGNQQGLVVTSVLEIQRLACLSSFCNWVFLGKSLHLPVSPSTEWSRLYTPQSPSECGKSLEWKQRTGPCHEHFWALH